eukprot:3889320-Alexandrium_andersonii.AAC.1
MGLLLASLRFFGLALDEHWRLWDSEGGCWPSVLDMPIQHLRPLCFQLAAAGRQRREVARRPALASNGGLERGVLLSYLGGLEHQDRVLAKRIASLGVWNQSVLEHAGIQESSCCPWCGAPKQSWKHMWWQCSHFAEVRERFKLPPVEDLPEGLANSGLPPRFAFVPGAACWGGQATEALGACGLVWEDMPEDVRATYEAMVGRPIGEGFDSLATFARAMQGDYACDLPLLP